MQNLQGIQGIQPQWGSRDEQDKFPHDVVTAAIKAHHDWKVFASITLAQWALESDFGYSMPLGSNNPFGIKASSLSDDDYVEAWTHEFIHHRYIKVLAKFAKYKTIYDAFSHHARLLHYSREYENAMKSSTYTDFANALTGIYATDPQYGAKLIAIIRKYGLNRYDGE